MVAKLNKAQAVNAVTGLVLVATCCATLASDEMFKVTVEAPDHGTLIISPPLPEDGLVAAGTRFELTAEAAPGYFVDSVFHAVQGRWWQEYFESMDGKKTVSIDADTTLGALCLPDEVRAGFSEIQDIVYAQPGVKPLKYDIFSPHDSENLPIVVIIHGGGWRTNTEDIMRGMARQIAKTGRYVVASADYRWVDTADGDPGPNSMADLIDDIFGALVHIQEHATSYGGDPDRMVVTGDSAGGHLSAVAATMIENIGSGGFGVKPGVFEFSPSYLPEGEAIATVRESLARAIKAAAPSYGVFSEKAYSVAKLEHHSDSPEADESWAAAIAPIHHIPEASERPVPHYLLRGTEDTLIVKAMIDDYAEALRARGQRAETVEVEGASHAFLDWKPNAQVMATFERVAVPQIEAMIAFFDGVLAAD